MSEITMPSLSDSMQEGTILSWLKSDGDSVEVGEELLEIETDKATMAYESPAAGVLRIVAAVGETLAVGAVIATLGDSSPQSGSDQPAVPAEAVPQEAAPAEPSPVAVAPADGNGSDPAIRATPLARRLARAHGVDLARVRGTGPRGRIIRSDVSAQEGVPGGSPAEPVTATAGSVPGAQAQAGSPGLAQTTTQELTRLQQVIARRMSASKATIPHFQVQTEVRMDALIGIRSELSELEEEVVPSINDFIVKACALALRSHPRANGSYGDGRFELHDRIHVGIAVAAPGALVVPTITDADQRSLRSIASQSRLLAERVRSGAITPPELSGATFTVSNLGMYGMTAITPVINPPQAAILGVGALRAVPALAGGELVEHQLMTLTLSCDHRILYGADAAQFLADIRSALETPLRLML